MRDFYGNDLDDWIDFVEEIVEDFDGGSPIDLDARARIVSFYKGDEKNPPNFHIVVDGSDSYTGAELIGDIYKDWGMYVDQSGDEIYVEPFA